MLSFGYANLSQAAVMIEISEGCHEISPDKKQKTLSTFLSGRRQIL